MRSRGARLAGAEERLGLGHRHLEYLADVPTAEERYFNTEASNRFPSCALLAAGCCGHAGHDGQVGVYDPDAVAIGAGALKDCRAEQGRLHPVGLGEGLADRLEEA